MCMNCGCGMPNDDMGNPKNIVWDRDIIERIKETAPQNGNTVIQELQNVYHMLGEEIQKMEKAEKSE